MIDDFDIVRLSELRVKKESGAYIKFPTTPDAMADWLKDSLINKGFTISNPNPIPIPIPEPPTNLLTQLGISVHCGWANPRPDHGKVPGVIYDPTASPNPWDRLQVQNRIPAINYYNEADPMVSKWYDDSMRLANIGWCVYQLDWMPKFIRGELPSRLLMRHCADNHPLDSPVKFCVSTWDGLAGTEPNYWSEVETDHGWNGTKVLQSFHDFATEVAISYMLRDNYLHIKNRPVMFRGHTENIEFYTQRFGVPVTEIMDVMANAVWRVTGKFPYFVATAVNVPDRVKIKGWKFDCFTEYLLHGYGWDNTMGIYDQYIREYMAFCRQHDLDYIVPFTTGYDGEAWNTWEHQLGARHIPTREQLIAHIRNIKQIALDNQDVCVAICGYSWNEYGESQTIAAPKLDSLGGDTILKAIRDAQL